MEWFTNWWNGLELFEQILYCIAIPSTLILLIQCIMIIFGFGHSGSGMNPSDTSGIEGLDGGGDIDLGDGGGLDGADGGFDSTTDTDINYSDGGNPADVGVMNFFTIQGLITFLCVFGWAGAIIYHMSGNAPVAVIISLILGLGAMYGVAKLLWASKKLAQNGTLNVRNLLGASGTVYLVIPAKGAGKGKVNVSSGERLVEFDAITDGDDTLADGTTVRVIDIRSGNVLVVEKV